MVHDSQSWSQSSPSTAGSTFRNNSPSLAVVKMPSVGRWVDEAVGVRKAAPRLMKSDRAEVILRVLGISNKGGGILVTKSDKIE